MIIAFVLLSAFLHAAWSALLRLEQDKDRSLTAAIVVATLFAALVAGVRWSLGVVPFSSLAGLSFTLIAAAFEALSFATLTSALERGTLGMVYTVSRGGAVLAVWPLSIALFSEVATVPAIVGSALVLGGLALSGLGSRRTVQLDWRGAVGWAVLCALSVAAFHLAYKAALEEATSPSACFALSMAVAAVIGVIRLGADGRRELRALARRRWPRLVLMGMVCSGSFLILLEALAIGGSGYVLTLRNIAVLFAVALGRLIGERPTRTELLGAALVAAGAAFMAL